MARLSFVLLLLVVGLVSSRKLTLNRSGLTSERRSLAFKRSWSPDTTRHTGGSEPPLAALAHCSARCTATQDCLCFRLGTELKATADESCHLSPPLANVNQLALNSTHEFFYTWDVLGLIPNKTNLARGKTATQSSDDTVKSLRMSAERAIDGGGDVGTRRSKKDLPSYSSTSRAANKRDTFPWWQVDLRKEYVIGRVTFKVPLIAPQVESGDLQLHDLEVRVGNSPVTSLFNRKRITVNSLCAFAEGPFESSARREVTITCSPCLTVGRFVSIQVVRFSDESANKTRPNGNVLALADLKVLGFDPKDPKEKDQ